MNLQRSFPTLSLLRLSSFPPKIIFPFNQTCKSSPISSSSSSLLPQLSLHWINKPCRRSGIRAFSTARGTAGKNGRDTFLAEESVSWASLGVSDRLSRALSNIGLHRPSLVQEACIPSIFAGNDVVVAAETGSGKTHGYLVPLFDRICENSHNTTHTTADQELSQHRQISLVLCPNVMLCEQVLRMANSICDDSAQPLLKVAAVCGRQGWTNSKPDVIVSTPAALLNYLYTIHAEKYRRTEFIRGVRYVVFDEADMLLCGSFENQVIRLINMLRFDEKVLSREKSVETEKHVDSDSNSLLHSDSEDHKGPLNDSIQEYEEDEGDAESFTEEAEATVIKRKDRKRIRKVYDRSKQYIFVAATLPVNGKKTAGGVLKRIFPDASWVSGNYLHCHSPRLEQKWIEVTVDTQVDALINALNERLESKVLNSDGEIKRTMVFANTVEVVEAVAKILLGAGIECLRYHSQMSLEDRTKSLVEFQQKGGVFVCTDAAARGLDIPNVSHVIQAEFATSAVDFLHRVGRTARAGQRGLVTSLYTMSNRDLVAAVHRAEKLCHPVEKAFSRKRGFRNKIKKKGFVKASDASCEEDLAVA